jgi:hypothetical protein
MRLKSGEAVDSFRPGNEFRARLLHDKAIQNRAPVIVEPAQDKLSGRQMSEVC